MRNIALTAVCAVLLMSSCGTYTGSGAYAGANIGSVLGSAIGGISGGWRGSDIGTIVGMAGGAVVGGVIGAQADRQAAAERAQWHGGYDGSRYDDGYDYDGASPRADRPAEVKGGAGDTDMSSADTVATDSDTFEQSARRNSGFRADNSGDDRIDFGSGRSGGYSAGKSETSDFGHSSASCVYKNYDYHPLLDIRNARFIDHDRDGAVSAGEVCRVVFEVYNNGTEPVNNVTPAVVETTGNRRIWISPSIQVESIAPGRGIRYTAVVRAGERLRGKNLRFCAGVVQGTHAVSKVCEFDIPIKR